MILLFNFIMNISIISSLPQNSWLINLTKKTAYIGKNLQKISENEFFEGSWAHAISPFSDSDTCIRFGSGFKVEEDKITIFTPSHSLESIYTIRKDNDFYISNSLAFVMSQFKPFIFNNNFKMKEIARPIW